VIKFHLGVYIFGLTEIIIGALTLIAVGISLFLGRCQKPLEVLIFVFVTCALSLGLGIGVLKRNLTSYHLLLFFSATIIFSKILIFAKIISLAGALETGIPQSTKNIISVTYHSLLIWYFTRPTIRQYFGERRNVLFSLKLPFSK
jgi:hypothetical protein